MLRLAYLAGWTVLGYVNRVEIPSVGRLSKIRAVETGEISDATFARYESRAREPETSRVEVDRLSNHASTTGRL